MIELAKKDQAALSEKKNIVIVLQFWGVVTTEPKHGLSNNERILFDYIYERRDKHSIKGFLYNSEDSIAELVREMGWATVLEAAGSDDCVLNCKDVINKICKLIPGARVGLAINDTIHLSRMLKQYNLDLDFDFILNSALVNCEFPSRDFLDLLRERTGDGRIVMVGNDFDNVKIPGIEIIEYDNRESSQGLYEVIKDYLSRE